MSDSGCYPTGGPFTFHRFSYQPPNSVQPTPMEVSPSSQWTKNNMDPMYRQYYSNMPPRPQSFIPEPSFQPPERSLPSSILIGEGYPTDVPPPPSYFNPSSFPPPPLVVQPSIVQDYWKPGEGYSRMDWQPSSYTPGQGPAYVSSSFPAQYSALSAVAPPSNQKYLASQQLPLTHTPSRVDSQQHSVHYSLNPKAMPFEPRLSPPRQNDPARTSATSGPSENVDGVPTRSNPTPSPSYSSVVANGREKQRALVAPKPRPPSNPVVPATVHAPQSTPQSSPAHRSTPQYPNNGTSDDNSGPSTSENRVENWVVEACKKLPLRLRAFFIAIVQSGCCVEGQLEPIHGSQIAETMRRLVASQGQLIPVTIEEAGKSVYCSFIDGGHCLICGEAKGQHVLECVRKHMRHRAFLCTSDDCSSCSGKQRQGFYEYSRLKEHLARPQQRATCIHCNKEFRKDNKKRHRCAKMHNV